MYIGYELWDVLRWLGCQHTYVEADTLQPDVNILYSSLSICSAGCLCIGILSLLCPELWEKLISSIPTCRPWQLSWQGLIVGHLLDICLLLQCYCCLCPLLVRGPATILLSECSCCWLLNRGVPACGAYPFITHKRVPRYVSVQWVRHGLVAWCTLVVGIPCSTYLFLYLSGDLLSVGSVFSQSQWLFSNFQLIDCFSPYISK